MDVLSGGGSGGGGGPRPGEVLKLKCASVDADSAIFSDGAGTEVTFQGKILEYYFKDLKVGDEYLDHITLVLGYVGGTSDSTKDS